MSSIGYYRYKIDSLNAGTSYLYFIVNGTLAKSCTIIVKPFCSQTKLLKYLNRDGQYRFFPFNKYYEIKDSPRQLGKTNELITSILTAQTNTKNLGLKNDRVYSLCAEDVTEAELLVLSDLFVSPRVCLYIGDGVSDNAQDWLQVEIKTKDNIVKRRKGVSGKVNLDIVLPEQFNITML